MEIYISKIQTLEANLLSFYNNITQEKKKKGIKKERKERDGEGNQYIKKDLTGEFPSWLSGTKSD